MVAALLIPLIALALIAGLISFMLAVGLNAGTPLRAHAEGRAAENEDGAQRTGFSTASASRSM